MAKEKFIKEKGRGERESGRGLVPTSAFGRLDVPYNSYLDELDPKNRPETQFALAVSNDIRFRKFLECLDAGDMKHYKLATIAKKCDISLPQFHEFWQSAQKNIALARAQGALPRLTEDLVEDAATRSIVCSRCDGYGVLKGAMDADGNIDESKLRPCPNCEGLGTVREKGDAHARDKIYEMTGMVKKGGGVAVQLVQNFGGMGIESAVDSMSKVSFAVDDEVIEAEVVSQDASL